MVGHVEWKHTGSGAGTPYEMHSYLTKESVALWKNKILALKDATQPCFSFRVSLEWIEDCVMKTSFSYMENTLMPS